MLQVQKTTSRRDTEQNCVLPRSVTFLCPHKHLMKMFYTLFYVSADVELSFFAAHVVTLMKLFSCSACAVFHVFSWVEMQSSELSGATVHNNYATALQKPYISPHLKVSTSLCSMPAEEVSASIEMHRGHYCPRGSHNPSWSTGGAGVKRAHPSFLRAPLSYVRLSQVLRWTLLLKSWPVSHTSFSRAVRLPLQETEISNFCDILLCNESVKGKWKGGDAP